MIGKRAFSVAYMLLLTLGFTSAVTLVYGVNEERIERNARLKLQKIVLDVLNVPVPFPSQPLNVIEVFEDRVRIHILNGQPIYMALSEDRRDIQGYAFRMSGAGVWGPIHGMMAVSRDLDRVLGVAFLDHSETPGLGGRISEEGFRNQFKGQPLPPARIKDATYFRVHPQATVRSPNEIDAITGATGTSNAVERMVNGALNRYLPFLAKLRLEQEELTP